METNNAERAITGSMTATVTQAAQNGSDRAFVAQVFEFGNDDTVWLLGREDASDDCEIYIYLALPRDFSSATVPVTPEGEAGASIYVSVVKNGYAKSGEVSQILWDQASRTFSGRFNCQAEDDNGIAFEVLDGQFNVNY